MGITIVKNARRDGPKKGAKKALILAGGAVTGASFMAGGLSALDSHLKNFSVNDFDIYVGISAGSVLAAPLVAGIRPEEVLRGLEGTSNKFTKFSAWHFYWPNVGEFLSRPIHFAGKVLKGDKDVSFYELLPSGLFDNSPIEHYIRKNIRQNKFTNSFKTTLKVAGKKLYIIASTLDGAKRAVFGPDEISGVTISQAIQASTAMPGFYKPVRINGIDYVDGGVQDTASIDVAVEKEADLIVCYNPFRPHTREGRIAGEGFMTVLNQIFRTFFHSRLHSALEQYRDDPNFNGNIILIEPKDDDKDFFDLNPLLFSNRVKAAELGFRSVTESIKECHDDMSKVLDMYGIKLA